MKEATGELSNAIVVTVCVAALVAFFYFTIWPMFKVEFNTAANCEKATCESTPEIDGMVKCTTESKKTIYCKYKG